MKLVLSARARADYKSIRAYTLDTYGRKQADLYRGMFEEAFDRLLDFPLMGGSADDIFPGLRRIPAGRHQIFYRIDKETVFIVAIHHMRQLPFF